MLLNNINATNCIFENQNEIQATNLDKVALICKFASRWMTGLLAKYLFVFQGASGYIC